jgi:hypothetical protein
LPLVVPDDAGAPVASNAPLHIPAVPQRPVCPLTPPECPSEPRTPSANVKEELSTPHPFLSPPCKAEDEYSSGNADESSEDLEIVPVHGGALACSVCPLGSPQLPCSANALIAVSLDSVYAVHKC